MTIKLDEQIVEFAVYGGAILGGGGGGKIEDGLQIGRLALEVGQPILKTAEEMADEDFLVTVSLVGAPAAKEQYVKPVHYVKAMVIKFIRDGFLYFLSSSRWRERR